MYMYNSNTITHSDILSDTTGRLTEESFTYHKLSSHGRASKLLLLTKEESYKKIGYSCVCVH